MPVSNGYDGHDEYFFDKEYEKAFGDNLMSFIYSKCGKSLNPERANVCPYSVTADEKRILLCKPYNNQ